MANPAHDSSTFFVEMNDPQMVLPSHMFWVPKAIFTVCLQKEIQIKNIFCKNYAIKLKVKNIAASNTFNHRMRKKISIINKMPQSNSHHTFPSEMNRSEMYWRHQILSYTSIFLSAYCLKLTFRVCQLYIHSGRSKDVTSSFSSPSAVFPKNDKTAK